MKTFVTGANGLLGANLVRELLKRGHQVRALVRSGSDLNSIADLDVELFYGDLLDESSIERGCKGCDYVIHAGGLTPNPHSVFSDYARINVNGTQNVVRGAEKAGISRMVYVSSCCVFGGGTLENPGTELSEFNSFKFNSGYINSKYLAQQWVLSEIEKKGFPIVIVNPTIMLGPFDSHPSSGEIILRTLKQKFQLCPASGKNFVDVRDVAVATCNGLTMGIPGECYLLGAENLTFSALIEKINRVFGRPSMRFLVPGPLLKCAGLVSSAMKALTNQVLPLSYCNSRLLAYESYFSAEKAVRVLRMPQTPIEDAIRDAIAWFVEHGFFSPYLPEKIFVPSAA